MIDEEAASRPQEPDAMRLWVALQALVLVAGDDVSGVIQRLESHRNIDARDRTALKTLKRAVALAQSILDQERPKGK